MDKSKKFTLYAALASVAGATLNIITAVLSSGIKIGSFFDALVNANTIFNHVAADWVRRIVSILLIILGIICIYKVYSNKNTEPLVEKIKKLNTEGIVFFFLLPLFLLSYAPLLFNQNNLSSNTNSSVITTNVSTEVSKSKAKIIIANFEGPDSFGFGISRKIYDRISQTTSSYQDFELERIDSIIDKSEQAKQIGEERKAVLVIWGHYFATNTNVEIHYNFDFPKQDIIDFVKRTGTTLPNAKRVYTDHRKKLDDFTIQGDLSNEMNFVSHLALGILHLTKEDAKNAIEVFTKAIDAGKFLKKRSDIYQAYLLRSFAHQINVDYKKSIADLVEVINKKPDNVTAYIWLAHTYIHYGRTKDIKNNYNKAIHLDPNDPDIYVCRCYYYFVTNQDFQKALDDCNKAVNLNGGEDAYLARGILKDYLFKEVAKKTDKNLVYTEGNNYVDEAISDISKAIDLYQHHFNYTNRGIAYLSKYLITNDKKFIDKALEDANKALEVKPQNYHSYLIRSKANFFYGDFINWRINYDKAIEFANINRKATLYYERGEMYLELGDYSSALSDFQQTAKIYPNFVIDHMPVYHKISQVFYRMGDYTNAIKAAESVLAKYKDYAPALRMKGQSLYHLGERKQAVQYCEKSRLKAKNKINIEMAAWCLTYIKENCETSNHSICQSPPTFN